jgi:hypothetical protein
MAAKSEGRELLIVFAPAEATSNPLIASAVITEIVIAPDRKSTTCHYSDLKPFGARNKRYKTDLKTASKRRALPRGFIRPYAICLLPKFLSEHRIAKD